MRNLCAFVGMFMLLVISAQGQTVESDSLFTNPKPKNKSEIKPYTHPGRTGQPQPRPVREGEAKQKPPLRNNTPVFESAPTENTPNKQGCSYLISFPEYGIIRSPYIHC